MQNLNISACLKKQLALLGFLTLSLFSTQGYAQTTTTTVCQGEPIFLTLPSVNGTIQWEQSSNSTNWTNIAGETNDTLNFTASTTLYYRAAITEGTCQPIYSDTSYIIVDDVPSAVTATASPNPVCIGADLTLTGSATNATSWSWTGPNGFTSSDQNPVINNISAADAGVYTLTVSNSCGAANAVNTSSVTVSDIPGTVTVNASPNPICAGNTLSLTGTSTDATTWNWTGPNGFTSSVQNPSINNITGAGAGAYTLTAGNSCGTAAPVNTVSVVVNDIPTAVSASASPNPICAGTNLALTGSATNATSWTWTGPNSFSSIAQNPTISNITSAGAGTYTLTAGNSCGNATTVNTTTVVVNDVPTAVSAAASPNPICAGSDLSLSGAATNATSWAWTGPNGFTSTIQNPVVTGITTAGGGIYTLTAQNSCGASPGASTSTVSVTATPTAANAGANQTGASTCGLTTVTLNANTPTNGTGSWSIASGTGGNITNPSSPTSTFTGTAGNTYTLTWTISNAPCVASSDNVNIKFNRNPTAANAGTNINPPCDATTATLNGNTPSVGTGTWTVVSGSATVTNPGNPNSGVTGLAIQGTATLRWTITNSPCTASTDDVVITTTSCGPSCGTQIWAQENVNIGTMVDGLALGSQMSDNGNIEKFCYNNVAANCATYGALYEWGEAMNYDPSANCDPCGNSGSQGLCPAGYHVPTDLEWSRYEYCVESTIAPTGTTTLATFQTGTMQRGSNSLAGPGDKLKATSANTPPWDGSNSSGFNAVPGGFRGSYGSSSTFSAWTTDAFFWTATAFDGTSSWERDFYSYRVYRSNLPNTYGFSLRCIRN